MKKLETTRQFDKQFSKLNPKLKLRFKSRVVKLMIAPTTRELNNHSLTGKYRGYNSINVTGNVRALYYLRDRSTIVFAFIGTHSQLYG